MRCRRCRRWSRCATRAPPRALAFGRVRPELSWWLPSCVRIASGGADRSQSRAGGRRARSLTGISINALWRPDNERRGQEMKTSILARLVAAGAMLAAAAGAAPAQALKPWKHGIIAPKADAGFLLMAAKRGFAEREGLKLELLEVKDDQIGLKALLA